LLYFITLNKFLILWQTLIFNKLHLLKAEQEHIKSLNKIKVKPYSWLSYLYFFFNAVGLPHGLLFTNFLTPIFYIWLWKHHQRFILIGLFLILIPYDIIHLILGVEMKSFLISNLLFISTYIFVFAFVYFINHFKHLERIFKQILIANFAFTLLAVIVYFTPYRETLWYINKFTESVNHFSRLALLTYEAAYYSLLFVPIAFYYLLKVAFGQNKTNSFYILAMVIIPLLLSLSIGVIASSFFAFLILFIINRNQILRNRNIIYVLLFGSVICLITLILLGLFYSENPVFIRITNILSGADTSANGRTVDSFTMAFRIANLKSLVFGSGLGQIKVLAPEMVQIYYNYWGKLDVVRIPNSLAETLAIFGLSGLAIRFFIIFYLFFKTKVLNNYYRTSLFIFIFIYQFTGSYITSIAEYVVWTLAFSNVFKQFDVKRREYIL